MTPFEKKLYLASPTMHGDEQRYVQEAFDTNWLSTVGPNIDAVEETAARIAGTRYAVGLSCGTAALHLAVRMAGVKPKDPVLCTDLTFDATVNPIVYEYGTPVFVDSEYDTWNMDPQALKKAFEAYPEAKVVMLAHLYGTPAQMDEILTIVRDHNAILIEDAAEALGAEYDGKPCGSFGDYGILSYNGNKIITGSAGGMFLTDSKEEADRVRKWSTQSREAAPWYEHEELGYNYRMSNVIAGIIRGQYLHLDEHVKMKQEIYERYKKGFEDLPVQMNPFDPEKMKPNYWLSCMTIDRKAMCPQVRSRHEALYHTEPGRTCPTQILDAIAAINAEGRPFWKPMHMQPIYMNHPFFTASGSGRARTNAYNEDMKADIVGEDLFDRGLCLPSDIKMTEEQQNAVIDTVRKCFE